MQLTSLNTLVSWGHIDPELDLYLHTNPLPKSTYVNTPIMQLRAQNRKIESAAFNALPARGVNETVITIPMGDGTESEIRICRPLAKDPLYFSEESESESENETESQDANEEDTLTPLIALFHGGGFVVGSNRQMAVFARAFTSLYGVTVASMSYRLAPEYPFPTAQDDAWDGVRWLADNAESLGANLTKGFVVGGVSAGGNLAISVTHRSLALAQKEREEGEKEKEEGGLSSPITGLWTAIPITTNGESIPEEVLGSWISRVQNAEAPYLSKDDLEYLNGLLRVDPMDPVFSPFADLCVFPALPPMYVQVAGMDPLRDDGLVYEAVAREMGVQTKVDVYPGMPHGFFYYFPGMKQSVKFFGDAMRNMGWLLGREEDEKRVMEVLKGMKGGR